MSLTQAVSNLNPDSPSFQPNKKHAPDDVISRDLVCIKASIEYLNQYDEDNEVREQYYICKVLWPFTKRMQTLANTKVNELGQDYVYYPLKLSDIKYKFCTTCGTILQEPNQPKCCNNMRLWVAEPRPEDVNKVIFHGGCQDGHGSEWAVHYYFCKKFGHEKALYMVSTYGASHDDKSEEKLKLERQNVIYMCKDRHVMIADFAYAPDLILEIKRVCSSFILLDHHDSNMVMLEGEPNCYFAMNHSGAYLAWAYMVTGVPLAEVELSKTPKLIRYIQDRDLWTYKEPDSKEIGSAIYIDCANKLENFDTVTNTEAVSFERLKERGKSYRIYEERIVEKSMQYAAVRTFAGYPTAVLNTTLAVSECGDYILRHPKYKDCRIAMIWRWKPKDHLYKFHLRRREVDTEINLGTISKRYKGGGHPASAGFVLPDTIGIDFVFKSYGIKQN